jgi:hypothetical protein
VSDEGSSAQKVRAHDFGEALAMSSYGHALSELDTGLTATLTVEHVSGELSRAGQVIQI